MSNRNRSRSRSRTPPAPFYGFREAPPGCALVPVHYKGEHVGNILVDRPDFERVNSHSWTLSKCNGEREFPKTVIAGQSFFPARLLLTPLAGLYADTLNSNAFDARRANLLLCDVRLWKQRANRRRGVGGFIGITPRKGKWIAQCSSPNGRCIGIFASAEAAARAYDSAVLRFYGPHARVNFPEAES